MFKNTSIKIKFITSFIFITLLISGISFFAINKIFNHLKKDVKEELIVLTNNVLNTLNEFYLDKVEDLEIFSNVDFVTDFLIKSNKESEQQNLDEKWKTSKSFQNSILDNVISKNLKTLKRSFEGKNKGQIYSEIFITNKYGSLVGTTNVTTDFNQADESWWINAKKNNYYIEKAKFDKSSNIFGNAISIKLTHNGEFIGVIKGIININRVSKILIDATSISPISDAKSKQLLQGTSGVTHEDAFEDMTIILSNKEMEIVASNKVHKKISTLNNSIKKILKTKKPYPQIHSNVEVYKKEENFFLFYKIKGEKDSYIPEGYLIAFIPQKKAYANITQILYSYYLLNVITFVISILLALFLANLILKPLNKLSIIAKEVGKGNFDVDLEASSSKEINSFANAFSAMKQNIERNTQNLKNAKDELLTFNKDLEAKIATRTADLEQTNKELSETKDNLAIFAKNLEKRLYDVDNMKNEFIANVSHELRTPLSIMKEGLGVLLDKVYGAFNENQEKVLFIIKRNISRLADIINELLDMSRIQSGKFAIEKEKTNFCELMEKIAKLFKIEIQKKGLEFKVEIPKEPIYLNLDPDKIIQVFINIIRNAIKFTQKGFIEISIKSINSHIECIIKDSGCGIKELDKPKIFKLFQQFERKPKGQEQGTGLGLVIAKGILEKHQGTINIESEEGVGTTVIIIIPKHFEEAKWGEKSYEK
jgi:signal transduction histidine kinase